MNRTVKTIGLLAAIAASTFFVSPSAEAAVRVGVSVRVRAVPRVRVVAVAPAPRPVGHVVVTSGAVWVPAHHNRYGHWVPGHWR